MAHLEGYSFFISRRFLAKTTEEVVVYKVRSINTPHQIKTTHNNLPI